MRDLRHPERDQEKEGIVKEEVLIKMGSYSTLLRSQDEHFTQVSGLTPPQIVFVLQCTHLERLRQIFAFTESKKPESERASFAVYLKELAIMEDGLEKLAAEQKGKPG
jgi:hypothetical protein